MINVLGLGMNVKAMGAVFKMFHLRNRLYKALLKGQFHVRTSYLGVHKNYVLISDLLLIKFL